MKYFSTLSLAAALLFSISVNAQTSADTAPLPALNPASVKSIESVKNDTGRGKVSNIVANAIAAGTSGAWAGTTVGQIEYVKGNWYNAPPINPIGVIPSGSVINVVYWTYSLSYAVPGQLAVLCDSARCVNISGLSQGSTSLFAGDSANSIFTFYFGVQGTGPITPVVTSGQDQVIVNYHN